MSWDFAQTCCSPKARIAGFSECLVPPPSHSFYQFTRSPEQHAEATAAKTAQPIPWSEIGAKAGADYKGDGLAVMPTESGARLRCVFQRLEGEATSEGLWLISTVTNSLVDRFQVK
ncbi:MAG TPA: hypothetical protein VNT26_02625, partial [Candidatus Sulfotelmatobacter sp.]|nr:hypothetical protein [Candidatus Sulfotelmatobacter sp.]